MNSKEFQSVTFKILRANSSKLNSQSVTEELLSRIARIAQLTVLEKSIHLFQPQGISATLILSESHIAIHTWPETGEGYITLTSCRSLSIETLQKIKDGITQSIAAEQIIIKETIC